MSRGFDRAYFEGQYRDYARQNPPRKLAFYRALAEEAAAGAPRVRILDVGCGLGLFLAALPAAWSRFGIDTSDYAVAQARAAVPGAQLARWSGGELPFPGPFDVITAFDVLEHMSDPGAVFATSRGALRPGGGMIFVVPVYDGPTGPVIRTLDRDPTHLHKRSRRFWLDLAAEHFELVDWWGIYRYLLPGGYYVHRVTRRLRYATPAIACRLRGGAADSP